MAITDPIPATYVSATTFTVATDRTAEFAAGVRVRADCGADGIFTGTVTASSHASGTDLTTVSLALDAGSLTANLTDVLHGNDNPSSLANHGHTGPADGGLIFAPRFDCRLDLSGSSLLLSPQSGNRLHIDGKNHIIPDAGVSLAAPGVANTTYYIYAAYPSGSPALLYSTTAPATANGIKVMTGDATKTLVGMARTDANGAWVDSATQRFVASFYNRRKRNCITIIGSDATLVSGSPVSIGPSVEFLSWSDDIIPITVDCEVSKNYTSGSTEVACYIFVDSIQVDYPSYMNLTASDERTWHPLHNFANYVPSDGYHVAVLKGKTSNSTASTLFSWASRISGIINI